MRDPGSRGAADFSGIFVRLSSPASQNRPLACRNVNGISSSSIPLPQWHVDCFVSLTARPPSRNYPMNTLKTAPPSRSSSRPPSVRSPAASSTSATTTPATAGRTAASDGYYQCDSNDNCCEAPARPAVGVRRHRLQPARSNTDCAAGCYCAAAPAPRVASASDSDCGTGYHLRHARGRRASRSRRRSAAAIATAARARSAPTAPARPRAAARRTAGDRPGLRLVRHLARHVRERHRPERQLRRRRDLQHSAPTCLERPGPARSSTVATPASAVTSRPARRPPACAEHQSTDDCLRRDASCEAIYTGHRLHQAGRHGLQPGRCGLHLRELRVRELRRQDLDQRDHGVGSERPAARRQLDAVASSP